MALVTLIKPITFTNGVKFELKVDDVTNVPYITMRDGPLEAMLTALSLTELAIPSDAQDMGKIARSLGLGIQVLGLTTPPPAP